MHRAFTLGKFLPFHKGHEAMIRYALSRCDSLTVIVCASDRETLPGLQRKRWIEATFEQQPRLEVKVLQYAEEKLPNTSVSSREASAAWARELRPLVPHCNLIITSEPYGAFVAEEMNIAHESFDEARNLVPVSSTAILSDVSAHWNYLPATVKPFFSLKVILSGTESTGKTMLSQRLATAFGATLVPEAARDLIADSRSFSFQDLIAVAQKQCAAIREAERGPDRLLVIDTDAHLTASYCSFFFSGNWKCLRNALRSRAVVCSFTVIHRHLTFRMAHAWKRKDEMPLISRTGRPS